MDQQQPGQVITPGVSTDQPVALSHNQPSQYDILPESATQQNPSLPQSEVVQASTEPQTSDTEPPQEAFQPSHNPELQATQKYFVQPEMHTDSPQTNGAAYELSWSASEPVAERKTFGWYVLYVLATTIISAAIFLLTKDMLSSGVVFIAGVGLLSIVVHKPGEQAYVLDDGHIAIGKKWYNLHDFKAFSIDADAHLAEVLLLPLRRFMPPLTLYLDQSNYEAVVQYLSGYIAQEVHTADAVERLIRRLRF